MKPVPPVYHVLIALVAGIVCGYAAWISHAGAVTAAVTTIEPIGALWVNAIRMTVIPLVVSLLFVAVASKGDAASVRRLGGLTLTVFVAFLSVWTLLVYFIGPTIFAYLPIDSGAAAALRHARAVAAPTPILGPAPTIGQWVADLAPANPVRAAADGALLPLLIFTVAFGLAAGRLESHSRDILLRFFTAVGEAMIALLRWIIAFAPIGVFVLTTVLVARIGLSALGAFAYFIVAICGVMTLQIISLYGVAAMIGRVGPRRFSKAVLPAQLVALSARSSLAALPALLEGANAALGLRAEVSAFVLPLASASFKFAVSSGVLINSLFIARLYGVPLDAAQLAVIAVSTLVVSFTTPGVPGGSFVILATVFAQARIPLEGIGILIAVDLFPDIFKTVLNVTANLAAATVVDRFAERRAPPPAMTPHSPAAVGRE